jgi:hypothetical protein
VDSRKLIRTSRSKDEGSLRDPVGGRNQRAVKSKPVPSRDSMKEQDRRD